MRRSHLGRLLDGLVTARRRLRTDDVTGLPNRRSFLTELQQAVRRQAGGEVVAAVLLDLDRFRDVNGALGHQAGDSLLRLVAARLNGCLRPQDLVARLGGDEFAFLLPDLPSAEAVEVQVGRILAQLDEPFRLSDVTIHVSASAGVALSPLHAVDGPCLLQKADVAMYDAKADGGGFSCYDNERDVYSRDRLQTIELLRASMDNRQLVVHYQPLVELATDTVIGVEALVRWNHPYLGLLPPDRFLPLAEQTGLMRPLFEYVLDASLAQLDRWRAIGHRLQMSVNISASNLLDAQFPGTVAKLLARYDIPAESLVLEVTETTLMSDPVRAQHVVERLDALGVSVAVDDYGTGYSSLAYLRDLAVQTLKLDRTFLKDLGNDRRASAIVRSTTDLAHELGLDIVAEGVEDEASAGLLRAFGCDLAQGYLYSRPVAADDLDDWLSDQSLARR